MADLWGPQSLGVTPIELSTLTTSMTEGSGEGVTTPPDVANSTMTMEDGSKMTTLMMDEDVMMMTTPGGFAFFVNGSR